MVFIGEQNFDEVSIDILIFINVSIISQGSLAWYVGVLKLIEDRQNILAGTNSTDSWDIAKKGFLVVANSKLRSLYVDRMKIRFPGIDS